MSDMGLRLGHLDEVKGGSDLPLKLDNEPVTIGATVPTGFEFTAAAEVQEKLGCLCKISKDRGKIYFEIMKDNLGQVHRLRSVDNLFVIVQKFADFPFKEEKESALKDLQDLAAKLPWAAALTTWEVNNSLKKKKRKKMANNKTPSSPVVSPDGESHKHQGGKQMEKQSDGKEVKDQKLVTSQSEEPPERYHAGSAGNLEAHALLPSLSESARVAITTEAMRTLLLQDPSQEEIQGTPPLRDTNTEPDCEWELKSKESDGTTGSNNVLKFRVTCNRAGDNHSFTSNEAARDFGGAVQDYFQWKADMTNFDIEVLLNINFNEVVVGIALTEESLHRRNITHFGPTTLRSTLAYGMLRLCDVQPSDVVIDPMCGTGSIPLEGVSEWPSCFFVAGDNNVQAVNRTASNICSLLRKQKSPDGDPQGLPIDAVHWDISRLPLRTGSVDVIVTDMPFGKRMGSRKKNWDLYPASLKEMSRVCRAGTGRAVLLTHDRKCFIKALAKASHVWRKVHTVWINIGGLHAGVYLLKRTALDVNECSEDKLEDNPYQCVASPSKAEESPSSMM